MHRLAALALAALLPLTARAECETPYDFDTMLNDLGAAEAGLRSMDYAAAIQTAQKMRDGLACLDQVMPVIIAPRVMRAIGAGLYVGGEAEDATRWFRAAAYIDPVFDYGTQDLPPEHPILRAWKAAKVEATLDPLAVEGAALGDGVHYVDGARVSAPAATPDAFHLYQRDLDGVRSWVIDGNAFPPEATGAAPEAVAVAPAPEPEPVAPIGPAIPPPTIVKTNPWPAERVLLVGGGGAALIGSGVLYALSSSSRSSFEAAGTVADLNHFRSRTNTFAVGSGVALAAGASAVGFGALFFVIDGDPRPTLDLRF